MSGQPAAAAAVSHRRIELAPVEALAALFDDGLPTPQLGDVCPPLWHWVALARWHPFTQTGRDGHARTGDLLPELDKPQRMFAGGRVDFHAALVVGDVVRQEDRVLSVTPKVGGEGEFTLVQIESRIYDSANVLGILEIRNLIYRDPAPARDPKGGATQAHTPVPAILQRAGLGWIFDTDPTALMRFSAATSNGHRIHFDYLYATQVENYPGLVVHGPLMTLALAQVLRHDRPDSEVASLTHRNHRPLFCGDRAGVKVEDLAEGQVQADLTHSSTVNASISVLLR